MKSLKKIISNIDANRELTLTDWKTALNEIEKIKISKPTVKSKKNNASSLKSKLTQTKIKIDNFNSVLKEFSILHKKLGTSILVHEVKPKEVEIKSIEVIKELSNEYHRMALYKSVLGDWKSSSA